MKDGDLLSDAGWSFIVRGLSTVLVEQIDDRHFEFAFRFNDGAVEKQMFTVPVMIYRGVWREGAYVKGDVATLGGSTWHCERATSDRPGISEDWKLMVKRGADGKPGKDGERGEKGDRGLNGRAGRNVT